jgi:hypothetical protein
LYTVLKAACGVVRRIEMARPELGCGAGGEEE